jgi:hypothetical protein
MKCLVINKKLYKIVAISLIVMSFLLYIIMPFNVCLPFSACIIAGITGAMVIVSEVIFWAGSLMIGKEVAMKMRSKFSIRNIMNQIRKLKKEK